MSTRYKTKNNNNYYVIFFLLLIVGIFPGIVGFIDIPAYADVCTEHSITCSDNSKIGVIPDTCTNSGYASGKCW